MAETEKPGPREAVTKQPLSAQLIEGLDNLAGTGTIEPEMYPEVGAQLYKLNLLLVYLRLQENVKGERPLEVFAGESAPDSVADALAERMRFKARMQEKKSEFLELLRLSCWEALQAARLLLDELKCATFAEDLIGEIVADPKRVSIKTNPPRPMQNQPTELSVWFHRPAYEHAAARDELFCRWKFPSGAEEKGWTVWHSFAAAGSQDVTVTFRDASGREVCGRKFGTSPDAAAVQLTDKVEILVDRSRTFWNQRSFVELIQIAISMLVVVAGLMAGAQEKIDQLDILTAMGTLVGLGFAADTVKNLVAPTNKKS